MKILLLTLVFILKNTVVFAHSPLNSISPKNNEILSQAPEQIKMNFKSDAKLVKVTLLKQSDEDKDTIVSNLFSNSNNKKIKIEDDALMKMSTKHIIGLPRLISGKYLFQWRAMSKDGHFIKGDINFIIE